MNSVYSQSLRCISESEYIHILIYDHRTLAYRLNPI